MHAWQQNGSIGVTSSRNPPCLDLDLRRIKPNLSSPSIVNHPCRSRIGMIMHLGAVPATPAALSVAAAAMPAQHVP